MALSDQNELFVWGEFIQDVRNKQKEDQYDDVKELALNMMQK